ncbi:MAG: flagellar basal body rod protein FlgC [Deltaproteobacteria bacterium]|nr:flagellar basal body rod protein FlgC [Deltaproteobacteria bacterium]
MNLFNAMQISASGLQAQRLVINVIATNLANAQTTETGDGGPYRRKEVVLSPVLPDHHFADLLLNKFKAIGHLERTHPGHFSRVDILPGGIDQKQGGVKAEMIIDASDFKMVFDPSHPHADASGYIFLPNINIVEEMVSLMGAVRSYEANVTAFNAAKQMALKALEISAR